MFGWTRIFTLVAVAVAVAIVTGGAGATSTSTLAPGTVSPAATAGKVSPAGSRRGTLLKTANLNTRAGVVRYLRAIGLDPRGLVIQRGARNYAGPNCPGAGWACTSTAHPVVQIAAAGGKNTFLCTTGSCAVVQATGSGTATKTTRSLTAATPTNKATCIKKTGLGQSCSISQKGAAMENTATVFENIPKITGLTQTASQTAQITQQATAGYSNFACVYQATSIDGSTNASGKKGTPVTVTLNAHQSVSITQDALSGNNTVQNATSSSSTAAECDSAALTQNQTLTSTAMGSDLITQNENAAGSVPNISLDIKQNQTSPGFLNNPSVTGVNTAKFSQTNTLSAIAITPAGGVNQTQSSSSGGIQATVNQFSHALPDNSNISTIVATQTETQCEHAQTVPLTTTPSGCPSGGTQPAQTVQVQYGPVKSAGGKSPTAASRSLQLVRKDPGSIQGDNSADTFTIEQHSIQNNDTGANQTNTVQGDCITSGNCTVTQTTKVDGQTTTNVQSGQNVTTSITCTGTTCTKPSTIIPVVNGSFEADTFSSGGTLDLGGTNPLTGWTTLSNGTYPWGLPNPPNTFNAGPTPYGNQWVIVGDFGNGGTWIEQTLNGLTPGHTYNLNFAAASEPSNAGGQSLLGVSFPSGSTTAGQTIAAPLTQVNFWDTWASFSVSFTASNSSVTFRFTGLAASYGSDPGIDNVSVTG